MHRATTRGNNPLNQWRIGITEDGLIQRPFTTLGLPIPGSVIFKEYGNRGITGQGRQIGRGFAQLQLGWEAMTQRQAAVLRAEIEAGQSAGGLYLTIDRATGQAPGPDWVDVFGKPWLPDFAPVSKSYGQIYEQVALRMMGVEVVNAPALPNPVFDYSPYITSVTAAYTAPFLGNPGKITVTVYVTKSTTVIITGDEGISGGGACAAPSTAFVFPGTFLADGDVSVFDPRSGQTVTDSW